MHGIDKVRLNHCIDPGNHDYETGSNSGGRVTVPKKGRAGHSSGLISVNSYSGEMIPYLARVRIRRSLRRATNVPLSREGVAKSIRVTVWAFRRNAMHGLHTHKLMH
jgi:hypothetical protein